MLARGADFTLVEGAGGWRVPLSGRETLADLAVASQLPVLLVVGLRLGCLNHALLTAEAIQAHCLSRLAKFKVPARVIITTTIPRTASGKVQKHLLPRD